MDEREPVTVLKLMEKTGLSRGFFYKNPMVRKELDRAFEQQAGMINPKKKILDMAMNHEIQSLLRQLGDLQKNNEKLMKGKMKTLKKGVRNGKNRESDLHPLKSKNRIIWTRRMIPVQRLSIRR
mgnify:CR=1 FL=1